MKLGTTVIRCACATVLSLVTVAECQAQATDAYINQVAKEIFDKKDAAGVLGGEIQLFALSFEHLADLLQRNEEHRIDEQIGATAGASGSTTLVSKGSVPAIFALAVENGAITRSQSGTTM